ncbi:MAG: hypothetical protein Q8P24_13490 [Desulfobacterales bacterium]|nr:hypothetical protein [Desulfobacterales bacterium]
MERNDRSYTIWQDDIVAYEEYHWAKNLTATNLEPVDLLGFKIQNWLIYKRIEAFRRESSKTIEQDVEETTFVAPKSPFDSIVDQLSDDEKVNEIVKFLNVQLNIPFAKKLAGRIQFLIEASKGEYPDEVAISPESLKNFVSFLQAETNLKYPDVVLSPSKNIRAQWRSAPNRHFAVEFLPTGDAHFVIFTPNLKHPDKTNRMSGILSVDSLMPTAQPLGVLSWCS